MRATYKKLLSEPLLHFAVLGAGLFLVFGLIGEAEQDRKAKESIVVTRGMVEHLAAVFTQEKQSPPTPEELKSLVDRYIEQEVFVREAVKRGLDKDDALIRLRMEELAQYLYVVPGLDAEPTEDELQAYYAAHLQDYLTAERFSFRQVLLPGEPGNAEQSEAPGPVLQALREKGGDATAVQVGSEQIAPERFENKSWQELASQFGRGFPSELNKIDATGTWQGPIRTSDGAHLVYLEDRTDKPAPTLDQVRSKVRADVIEYKRKAAQRATLDKLMEHYEVTVQGLDPSGSSSTISEKRS